MNIKWDYGYYQPWSDNEWLVDKMIALINEDITMQQCIEYQEILNGHCKGTPLFLSLNGMTTLQSNLSLFN